MINEAAIGVPQAAISEANAALLGNCSFEMVTRDRGALDAAREHLPQGAEVFIANTQSDALGLLVETAREVRRAGFVPVPHVVARNIAAAPALDDLLARLSGEAAVDRALLLGGDRDRPAGAFGSAVELMRTNLLQKHGIGRVAFACYPERHPRIPDDVLRSALAEKISLARQGGIEPALVSQFAFEAEPILDMVRRLRRSGMGEALRIGLAGPVNHARLLRYALRCGVGPSLRILRDRKDVAFNLLAGETPDALVAEIVAARSLDPSLAIDGIHLFTFGALAKSAQWVQTKRAAQV